MQINTERKPTLHELMRWQDYTKFNLDELAPEDKRWAYPILFPEMKKAKEKLPRIEAKLKEEGQSIEGSLTFGENVHRMDKRLVSAWLRSCYLNRGELGDYGMEKGESIRVAPSFVPREFMTRNSTLGRPGFDNPNEVFAHGLMYLKYCLGPGTVEDTFVSYFSSGVEAKTAIAKSKNTNYLPRVVGNNIKEGYQKYMPPPQRNLINSAIAIYMITDEDGKIHYDWMPEGKIDYGVMVDVPPIMRIYKDISEKKDKHFERLEKNLRTQHPNSYATRMTRALKDHKNLNAKKQKQQENRLVKDIEKRSKLR